jgi:hypothetical protein
MIRSLELDGTRNVFDDTSRHCCGGSFGVDGQFALAVQFAPP